jgi:hypothetical protein
MPTPDVRNHCLHMNAVIAWFPIGEQSTDYAYMSKSTAEWQFVLVSSRTAGDASSGIEQECRFHSRFL